MKYDKLESFKHSNVTKHNEYMIRVTSHLGLIDGYSYVNRKEHRRFNIYIHNLNKVRSYTLDEDIKVSEGVF